MKNKKRKDKKKEKEKRNVCVDGGEGEKEKWRKWTKDFSLFCPPLRSIHITVHRYLRENPQESTRIIKNL